MYFGFYVWTVLGVLNLVKISFGISLQFGFNMSLLYRFKLTSLTLNLFYFLLPTELLFQNLHISIVVVAVVGSLCFFSKKSKRLNIIQREQNNDNFPMPFKISIF